MLPRTVALALAVLLVAGGCDDGSGPAGNGGPSASRTPPPPPTPAERLHLTTGWGPSQAEIDRAARLVTRMSLPQLAGQVIVASYAGTGAPTRMVDRLHLGGVIAFSDNIVSTGQIGVVNARLQRAAHRPYPVWTSVDQEGGIVERVKGTATRFPAFMSTGAVDDPDLTRTVYAASGAELRRLGFTADFAPDADVTTGPTDPTIGSRSAGSQPGVVAEQALAAAHGFLDAGVLPVLKHFPGHGSVPADSHQTLPVQARSLKTLRGRDLVPFARAVDAGLPAVMVAHIAVRAVDPGVPSSLSPKVVDGLLRHDLGFDGLVVTDSLQMAAVTRDFTGAESAVRALRGGADVLLMPPDPRVARIGIIRAVMRGHLAEGRLQQAAARMIALLLHQQSTPGRGAAPGSARKVSSQLSSAAITSVAGPCTGKLFDGPLVPVGDPVAVADFRAAAAASGVALGRVTYRKPPRPPRRKHRLLRIWKHTPPRAVYHGTPVDLVGYGQVATDAPIVIATDTPYVLGTTSAPVRIATYGATPGAMQALVQVLLGKARAPGHLPVPVSGVARHGC
jgi:beta-N-acetylhexosaminidase